MCDLDGERIPYRVLCRSIFDGDPSSFFLAQYRCLEALYAYSSAQGLIRALSLNKSWGEVATVLEEELGWHPQEQGSLAKILSFAAEVDLRSIFEATTQFATVMEDMNLATMAAKKIYGLRNSIVHYRPAQHRTPTDRVDWVLLCTAIAGIVVDVYNAVFTGNLNRPKDR